MGSSVVRRRSSYCVVAAWSMAVEKLRGLSHDSPSTLSSPFKVEASVKLPRHLTFINNNPIKHRPPKTSREQAQLRSLHPPRVRAQSKTRQEGLQHDRVPATQRPEAIGSVRGAEHQEHCCVEQHESHKHDNIRRCQERGSVRELL